MVSQYFFVSKFHEVLVFYGENGKIYTGTGYGESGKIYATKSIYFTSFPKEVQACRTVNTTKKKKLRSRIRVWRFIRAEK